jgi:hypothetical protein
MPEISLVAPYLFDQSIGYWTGEPDREALARALAAVPQHPEVEREALDDRVILRGPEEAIVEEARLLREAGLE